MFSSGLIIRGLNFVFAIFTARLLGEVGLGSYATIAALVGMFGVFFELGLSQYVERTIAQDARRAAELFWNLLLLRLILAIAGIVSISGLAVALGYDREMSFGVFLFTCTFALAAIQIPLSTVLSANERFEAVGLMEIVGQLTVVGVGTLLLLLDMGYYALLFTGFVAMPAQIAIGIWALRRFKLGPFPFRIDPGSWRRFIKASIPFGITALALNFNYQADTVILEYFRSVGEVGWYNGSYRLVLAIVSVAGSFLTVMTPALAREHASEPQRVHQWVRSAIVGTTLIAMPIAVGGGLLAGPIITLLYGAAFTPAGAALAILCWDVPLVLLLAMAGNITTAIGQEHPAARIYFVSAVANVVLNLIFIPRFGMIGASWITILTDALITLWFYRLLAPQMALRHTLPALGRIVLAAGAMGVGVAWLNGLGSPLLLTIVVGAVLYAVLAVGMGLVKPQSLIHWLRRRGGAE